MIACASGPDVGGRWHSGDPMRVQRHLTAGESAVDLSHHDVLTITGPDRLTFLHSLSTQKLDDLAVGASATALLLSPTGHIEHWLGVVDDGDTAWIHAEPGVGVKLQAWFEKMRFMSRIEVSLRADVALVWIPRAEASSASEVVAVRVPDLGGRELFVARESLDGVLAAEAGDEIGGAWEYEALRIAAGIPRIGVDTDHRTLPNEIGLLGTKLDKGCYRGQETVARVHNLGRVPRRLIRLHLDGSADELPPVGAAIKADGDVGCVGASARHHELGPIALGLIKRSVPTDADLTVSGIAASQEVLVDPDVGLHVKPTMGKNPAVRQSLL